MINKNAKIIRNVMYVTFLLFVTLTNKNVYAEINAEEIIKLTNKERSEKGLTPLNENSLLNKAAENKALDMIENNYWSHVGPNGKYPWDYIKDSGYTHIAAGENLAKGYKYNESVIEGWLQSETHRNNLFSPSYKDIGVAVVKGKIEGKDTTLIVQMFGDKEIEYNQSNFVDINLIKYFRYLFS